MARRALLIFADEVALDLSRRRLPAAALPLLQAANDLRRFEKDVDVHVFGPSGRSVSNCCHFHPQRGCDFAQRFEHAIEAISALGYDEIVTVGRDCPALRPSDIILAFERLRDNRLVLGPDHRGGCYLIGFRAVDLSLLRNIRWKRNTDCAELRARCGESSAFLLGMKHDIDSWTDVGLAVREDEWLARLASFLLCPLCAALRQLTLFVHAAARFVRVHGQMPPPVLLS